MEQRGTKLRGAITIEDIQQLRAGIKKGEMVPCVVEIRRETRNDGEHFFEEAVRKLQVKRKYPHIVALSGMGIYRDTTMSYAELALLLRAEGKRMPLKT